jgi:elongin-C
MATTGTMAVFGETGRFQTDHVGECMMQSVGNAYFLSKVECSITDGLDDKFFDLDPGAANVRSKQVMSSHSQEPVSYVKLISAEGHEFFLDRQVAIEASKTIRLMLSGSFREAQDNVIRFPDIAGYVLERVVQYFHYKAQHSNSSNRLPTFNIEPEIALELLLAAKYLDC